MRGKYHTLECHDITTAALHHLRNHVVNESVLIPYLLLVKFFLVCCLEDILKDVLETTIVLLQDGVLRAHVERQRFAQSQFETSMREALDGLVGVVLCLRNSSPILELVNFNLLWLAALGCENHLQCTISLDYEVLCTVLVTECVTTNDDRLLPAWYQPRNSWNYDGLSEDGTS